MNDSKGEAVDADMTLHIQYANEEYKDTIQASLFLGIFGQSLSSLYPEPPTMEISHLGIMLFIFFILYIIANVVCMIMYYLVCVFFIVIIIFTNNIVTQYHVTLYHGKQILYGFKHITICKHYYYQSK